MQIEPAYVQIQSQWYCRARLVDVGCSGQLIVLLRLETLQTHLLVHWLVVAFVLAHTLEYVRHQSGKADTSLSGDAA